jgi:membrane protease YdiL (CAAX protease family)
MYLGVLAVNALSTLLLGPGGTEAPAPGAESSTPSVAALIIVLLAVAVTAPIVEELAFRGYLFPALMRWRGPWIAAGITALLFGFAHLAVAPVEAVPGLAAFGFGTCLLFWFTGSLLPAVGLHAFHNALVTGLETDWTWQVPVVILACVLISVGLLVPFARERAPVAT